MSAGECQDKPRQNPVMLTDEAQNVWNLFVKQDPRSSSDEFYYIGISEGIQRDRALFNIQKQNDIMKEETCENPISTSNIKTAPLLSHPFMQTFININDFWVWQGKWKMGQQKQGAESGLTRSLPLAVNLSHTQINVFAVRLSFPSDSLKIPFPVGICHCVFLPALVTRKLKPWPSESNSKTQTAGEKTT